MRPDDAFFVHKSSGPSSDWVEAAITEVLLSLDSCSSRRSVFMLISVGPSSIVGGVAATGRTLGGGGHTRVRSMNCLIGELRPMVVGDGCGQPTDDVRGPAFELLMTGDDELLMTGIR